MNSRKAISSAVIASLALIATLATQAEATLIGRFEQLWPDPIVYTHGTTVIDPAPFGIDYATFQDFGTGTSLTAFGDVTGKLQYVPGLGAEAADFAGFVAGNIAVIDRSDVFLAPRSTTPRMPGPSASSS